MIATILFRAPTLVWSFAQVAAPLFAEAGVCAAILLTLLGMVLHWQAPQRRMSLEERLKDGKVTEDEVRRQVRFLNGCARIVMLIGVGVLFLVLFALLN